jgi:hypothetical protein
MSSTRQHLVTRDEATHRARELRGRLILESKRSPCVTNALVDDLYRQLAAELV